MHPTTVFVSDPSPRDIRRFQGGDAVPTDGIQAEDGGNALGGSQGAGRSDTPFQTSDRPCVGWGAAPSVPELV